MLFITKFWYRPLDGDGPSWDRTCRNTSFTLAVLMHGCSREYAFVAKAVPLVVCIDCHFQRHNLVKGLQVDLLVSLSTPV